MRALMRLKDAITRVRGARNGNRVDLENLLEGLVRGEVQSVQAVSAAATIDEETTRVELDSSGGTFALTIPEPTVPGKLLVIEMITAGNDVTMTQLAKRYDTSTSTIHRRIQDARWMRRQYEQEMRGL